MNNKKAPKNPLWETLTVGMEGKWTRRFMIVMVPVFIGLMIARPFVDATVEKRIKLKEKFEEEEYQRKKEERMRKLRESGDPYVIAMMDNIEEGKRTSDQQLSRKKPPSN